MIETISDFNTLLNDSEGDWIVHIIPERENVHPVEMRPCIIFIRSISSSKTYYYSVSHKDSLPSSEVSAQFINLFLLSKNRKWVLDKKSFTHVLKIPNVYDANLVGHWKHNTLLDSTEFFTPAHNLIRRNSHSYLNENLAIPLMKHKEMFDEMADGITRTIKGFVVDDPFIKFDENILTPLRDLEAQGIYVDRKRFSERFKIEPNKDSLVYSQYNVYTSTGRPSNRFGGVNYAALNQSDGTRNCFISRHGKDGIMVVIDYTTFHPRIICKLTNYNIPIQTDIYQYLAKLYFHKKEVDDTDIRNAKQLTFRQFFGGVEEEYSHIKYLSNLKSFIDEQWDFFNKNGYVLTPIFKRKITSDHIKEPNPPKVFNYILQAIEGEISISKLKEIISYLQPKKTKAVLYTYDAVLYDFHKDDGFDTLQEIRELMSYGGIFPTKVYIGHSYNDISLVDL